MTSENRASRHGRLAFKAALLVFLTSMALPALAYQAPVSDLSCSPEVWSQLNAKSHEQIMKENVIYRDSILRPDSVFAMTCFNNQMLNMAHHEGVNVASEDGLGPNTSIPFKLALDEAFSIAASTLAVLAKTFMGAPLDGNVAKFAASLGNMQVSYESGSIGPFKHTCYDAALLWAMEKCGGTEVGLLNGSSSQTAGMIGTPMQDSNKFSEWNLAKIDPRTYSLNGQTVNCDITPTQFTDASAIANPAVPPDPIYQKSYAITDPASGQKTKVPTGTVDPATGQPHTFCMPGGGGQC